MRSKSQTTIEQIEFYVDSFFDKERRSPSLREIEQGLKISRQTISRYLKYMDNNGILKYNGKTIITQYISSCFSYNVTKWKLVGNVVCGYPKTEEQFTTEYIYFPKNMLSNGEYFVLKTYGDSMVNAGIDDGDLVIIKRQNYATTNQIVVALDDNEGNTLKRLMYDGERYYLHAENKKYCDLYPKELKIQGVAVKVIKDL